MTGSTFHFQMHYTPNGQVLTDVTRLGLYFMKDAPKYSYRSLIFAQPRLKIPAGTKEHTEVAQNQFKSEAIIYSLHPHAHFRGKASSFVAGAAAALRLTEMHEQSSRRSCSQSGRCRIDAGRRRSTDDQATCDHSVFRAVTWLRSCA